MEPLDIQAQLAEKWLVFWWALVVGSFILVIAWRQGFFTPFKTSLLTSFIRGVDVLRGFSYFLLAEILLIPLFFGVIFHFEGWELTLNTQARGWLHLIIIIGGFGAVSIAYLQLMPTQRKVLWGESWQPWFHHLAIGIAAWFVSFPFVLAISQLVSITVWHLFHHSLVEQIVVQNLRELLKNPLLFFFTALAIVTIVPFTEEFLFRGLLQSWLKRKFHQAPLAIVVTSIIFALFHFSTAQGFTNIELLSSLFLLSCMLGFVFERQRSLWASIGMHAFFNFMSLLMIFKE